MLCHADKIQMMVRQYAFLRSYNYIGAIEFFKNVYRIKYYQCHRIEFS